MISFADEQISNSVFCSSNYTIVLFNMTKILKSGAIVFLLLIDQCLFAQRIEVGVFAGITNYMGDLAPHAFIPGESHPSYGALGIYNLNRWVSVKYGFFSGNISGSDARNAGAQLWRLKRNLSFRSPVIENSIQFQINLFGWRSNNFASRITPYIQGGFGVFKFNPQAFYNGGWVDLQPLGTEGQGLPGFPTPYKLTQLCFPIGGGIKYAINKNWSFSSDISFRKTMTDYLDDVSSNYADVNAILTLNGTVAADLSDRSNEIFGTDKYQAGDQRGNPNDMDWYFYPGFTLNYTFTKSQHNKTSEKEMGDYGCYRFHRWRDY